MKLFVQKINLVDKFCAKKSLKIGVIVFNTKVTLFSHATGLDQNFIITRIYAYPGSQPF